MPFIKRKIEPSKIGRFQKTTSQLFDEHSDFANNAMVNSLLQLASLTFHAEGIFKEIETESKSMFKRISNVRDRLQRVEETTRKLDPKSVQIPVSDLDTEFKISPHLQYQSRNSIEEDFFTADSRNPCLIHLHQLARNDFNDVVRGAQAYAKPARPKSFDPNMLLDDKSSSDLMLPSKSTVNIAASRDLNELFNPQGLLPTPQKKAVLDNAQHKAELVSVDTSGTQFDRRVNLRRSQRSTVSGSRKSHMKLRERHKTLTALPDYVSSELGIYGMQRQNSLHSDVNSTSSFLGEGSVVSADSSLSPRSRTNGNAQTVDRSDLSSSNRTHLQNRHSMSAVKTTSNLPSKGARVTLTHSDSDKDRHTLPHHAVESKPNPVPARVHLEHDVAPDKHQLLMREKNGPAEDRISSGFWSGTESCRHSITSETLTQSSHVTLTPKHNLSKQQDENRAKAPDNSTNASSLSINSRLSTLDHSLSSSFVSLTCTPGDHSSTPDDSMYTQRIEPVTPRRYDFSTPAGAYNFMNSDYVEEPVDLPRLSSPMDLIIIGNRRGSDGLIRDTMESFDVSGQSYSIGVDVPDSGQCDLQRPLGYDHHSVFTPNTPQTAVAKPIHSSSPVNSNQTLFFPRDFSTNHDPSPRRNSSTDRGPSSSDFQSELRARLESDKRRKNSLRKPPPPRRQSSLKSRHKEVKEILAYMEPLSNATSTTSHRDQVASPTHSNAIRSPLPYSSAPDNQTSPSASSFETSESDSPPANISSYQPSKSVASMLSKRPSDRYNFHLTPTSPVDRPVSVVEPIPQSFPSPPPCLMKSVENINPAFEFPVNEFVLKPLDLKVVEKPPLEEISDAAPGLAITPALLKTTSMSLKRVSIKKETKNTRSEPVPSTNTTSNNSSFDQSDLVSLPSRNPLESDSADRSSADGLSNGVKSPPPLSIEPVKLEVPSVEAETPPKNTLPRKPPVAAKPTLSPGKKPTIRPKPAVLSRPASHPSSANSANDAQQPGVKSRHIKEKTADLRADFFRSLSTTNTDLPRKKLDSRDKATNNKVEVNGVEMTNGESSQNHVVSANHINHDGPCATDKKEELIDPNLEKNRSTTVNSSERDGTVGVSAAEEDSAKSNEEVSRSSEDRTTEKTTEDTNFKQLMDKPLECVDASADTAVCNGVDSYNHVNQINGDEITADVFESPTSSSTKFDFKSSMHKLRGSYSTMTHENGGNGFKSPISPLIVDKRSSCRYSTSSLDRRRKGNSGSTSRDDFKTLLLQNLSKSGTGSQMSATEKLQMSMQSRNRGSSGIDDISNNSADTSSVSVVSTGDIRVAMTTSRPGRRPNRILDNRRSYVGSPSYLNKKHPPLSMSGRYSARSRTPTRPMMAISEDVENEVSPEKPSDDVLRSKSVGDF